MLYVIVRTRVGVILRLEDVVVAIPRRPVEEGGCNVDRWTRCPYNCRRATACARPKSSRVATTTSSSRKIASPCSYLLSSWPRPSPSLGDHAHIPLIAHKIISNCPPVLKPTNNDWLVNSKLNQSVIRRVGKRTHVFTNGRKYSLDYNMDDEFVKAGYTFAGIVFASLSSC